MQIAVLAVLGAMCLLGSAPPALPQTARKPAQPARPSMTVVVTDLVGNPVPDATVRASGAVDREASTDGAGSVTFTNVPAGTYRLRFEHDGFVTFEREVVHGARPSNVNVALTPAAPKPEAAPPLPAAPSAPVLPPAGPPTFVSIIDFFEKNYVGSAPSLISQVGCVPSATSKLLQLREPLGEHVHADSDELLYVVAGEGTHRVAGRDIPLQAGVFATVPRGVSHSITRKGRNPIIVLSIVTEPCQSK
jgi:mannose-6-phosphate isomerase-like protein (cupin superfamily)